MASPLKVRLRVEEPAWPVLGFLRRHGYDVGSVSADRFYRKAPPDQRYLCVALTDADALVAMIARMQLEFTAELVALTNRVILIDGALGTKIVVFLDIAAIELPS